MIRTQIYLDESAKKRIKLISAQTGKRQSELIRDAINQFLSSFQNVEPMSRLKRVKGIWKDRNDLPDFDKLRKEWDR